MSDFSKLGAIMLVLLLTPFLTIKAIQTYRLDPAIIYNALAGKSISQIDAALQLLNESASSQKQAYEGALTMKKAGLLSKPKDKLQTFKAGRKKLEAAIASDPGNIEYRFLRVLIQENAPKILKYKNDLETDSALIRASFKKLSQVVQQAVKDYSYTSKVLNNIES